MELELDCIMAGPGPVHFYWESNAQHQLQNYDLK